MNITDTQKYLISGKLKVQRENEHIAPLAVEKTIPAPDVQFTDTARLKVALDIEINLVVNGQKVLLQ